MALSPISTMHFAKGLEFRSVVGYGLRTMTSFHNQDRIEMVADDADLEEVYNTEPAFALCRVHPRPRSSSGNGHRPGVRVC